VKNVDGFVTGRDIKAKGAVLNDERLTGQVIALRAPDVYHSIVVLSERNANHVLVVFGEESKFQPKLHTV
jgi:hypothetical protein